MSCDFVDTLIDLQISKAALGLTNDHGSLLGLGDDDHPQYGALAQNEVITGRWEFGALTSANQAERIALYSVSDVVVQWDETTSAPWSFVSRTRTDSTQTHGFRFSYNYGGSGTNPPTNLVAFGESVDSDSLTVFDTTAFRVDSFGTAYMSRKNTVAYNFDGTAEQIAGLGPTGGFVRATGFQTWSGVVNVFDNGIAVGDTDRSIYFDNDFVSNRLSYDPGTTRFIFDKDLQVGPGGAADQRLIFNDGSDRIFMWDEDGGPAATGLFSLNVGLSIAPGSTTQPSLALYGASARGGSIEWRSAAPPGTLRGYTFVSGTAQLVFDSTFQSALNDPGNAWIDFDDGAASFAGGLRIGTGHAITTPAAGLTTSSGVYLSGVTDVGGNKAHSFTTASLTSGGAAEGDLRRIASWSNVTTEQAYVTASGAFKALGGIWAGEAQPIDGSTGANKNRFSYTETATSGGFNVVRADLVRNAAAGSAGDRGIFFVVEEASSATQSGFLIGASFSNAVFGTTARTLSGSLYGGVFSEGWSNTGIYGAVASTAGMFAGLFQYFDYGAATSAHTATTSGFINLEFDASGGTNNYLCTTTNFWGIQVPDLSLVNATNSQVMSIASQTAHSAAGKNNIHFIGGNWNTGHVQLKDGHAWFNDTNNAVQLRGSAPGDENDGVGFTGEVVATGSGTGGSITNGPWAGAKATPDAWLEVYQNGTRYVAPLFTP